MKGIDYVDGKLLNKNILKILLNKIIIFKKKIQK
jgi:hypothetical protein